MEILPPPPPPVVSPSPGGEGAPWWRARHGAFCNATLLAGLQAFLLLLDVVVACGLSVCNVAKFLSFCPDLIAPAWTDMHLNHYNCRFKLEMKWSSTDVIAGVQHRLLQVTNLVEGAVSTGRTSRVSRYLYFKPGRLTGDGSGDDTLPDVSLNVGQIESDDRSKVEETIAAGKCIDEFRIDFGGSPKQRTSHFSEHLASLPLQDAIAKMHSIISEKFEGTEIRDDLLAVLNRRIGGQGVIKAIDEADEKQRKALCVLTCEQNMDKVREYLSSYHCNNNSDSSSLIIKTSTYVDALSEINLLIVQLSLLNGMVYTTATMGVTTWLSILIQIIKLGCSKWLIIIYWRFWTETLEEARQGGYLDAFCHVFVAASVGFDGSIFDGTGKSARRFELIVPDFDGSENSIGTWILWYFEKYHGLTTESGDVKLYLQKSKTNGKDVIHISVHRKEALERIARKILPYLKVGLLPREKLEALKNLAGGGHDPIGSKYNIPDACQHPFSSYRRTLGEVDAAEEVQTKIEKINKRIKAKSSSKKIPVNSVDNLQPYNKEYFVHKAVSYADVPPARKSGSKRKRRRVLSANKKAFAYQLYSTQPATLQIHFDHREFDTQCWNLGSWNQMAESLYLLDRGESF